MVAVPKVAELSLPFPQEGSAKIDLGRLNQVTSTYNELNASP